MPGFIFEQACVLAKGIDYDDRWNSNRESTKEAEGWVKVWTSLFVRDKSFSLCRGRSCCLPAVDWSPLNHIMPDAKMTALLELSKVKEDMYAKLYSKESLLRTPSRRAASMLALINALGKWEESNRHFLNEKTPTVVDLQLEYRSTRTLVLRLSAEPSHREEVLNDAKAACRILTEQGTSAPTSLHR